MIVATTPTTRFPITLSTKPIMWNNEFDNFIKWLKNSPIPVDCPMYLLSDIERYESACGELKFAYAIVVKNSYTVKLKDKNDAAFFKTMWC